MHALYPHSEYVETPCLTKSLQLHHQARKASLTRKAHAMASSGDSGRSRSHGSEGIDGKPMSESESSVDGRPARPFLPDSEIAGVVDSAFGEAFGSEPRGIEGLADGLLNHAPPRHNRAPNSPRSPPSWSPPLPVEEPPPMPKDPSPMMPTSKKSGGGEGSD